MEPIYHVTTAEEWNAALIKRSYEADSLHTEGFIHCSKRSQLQGVLERYYQGRKDLVLLTIDPEKLNSMVKYEVAPSVNEEFPHVYGPVNIDAVKTAEPIL